MKMAMAAGAVMIALSSCGQIKGSEDSQTSVMSGTAEISDSTGEVQKTQNDDNASVNPDSADILKEEGQPLTGKEDELENLTGEYDYLSDYGVGKLIIKKGH